MNMASRQNYNTGAAASFDAGKGFSVDPLSGDANLLGFRDSELIAGGWKTCSIVSVSIITTMMFWGSLVYVLFFAPGGVYFFAIPGVLYIFQLVGVYLVSRQLYLKNTVARTEAHQTIHSWHTAQPEIIMRMECFHYVTTTRRSNGKTTTETRKVVTHRAGQRFHYDKCEDASGHIPYLRLRRK
eukprot:TRINITY_DN1016_c0_g2_i1.p1 TRINITY_DN1016_c0_g2~~TRINITY_DN1016_c0_g2_i1.p1  ORF type:complete len:184 (+),score=27.42 TRINITY_DN1016_c0_g2_i1:40-591(+)